MVEQKKNDAEKVQLVDSPEVLSKDDEENQNLLLDSLVDEDPHNIFSLEKGQKIKKFEKEENKSGCCKKICCKVFCGFYTLRWCFNSFLKVSPTIKASDSNKNKNKGDSSYPSSKELMKDIGLGFFLHLPKDEQNEQAGQPSPNVSPDKKDNLTTYCSPFKTTINIIIFVLNFYILVIHSIFTEPGIDEDGCSLRLNFLPPKRPKFTEIILILGYILIPIFIARLLKFIWESESFPILVDWYKQLEDECKKAAEYTQESLKQQIWISLLWTFLWSIIAISMAAFAIFGCSQDGKKLYVTLQFFLVIVLFASLSYAIAISYNIIRAYTTFITTRIALYQAKLKAALKENVKLKEALKENDDNPNNTEGVEKIYNSLVGDDPKKPEIKKYFYEEAEEMFEKMKRVTERTEKAVQFCVQCLRIIFIFTLAYMFFYSLYFYDNLWPLIKKEMIFATVSPTASPTASPTSSPTASPSASPSASPTRIFPVVGCGDGGCATAPPVVGSDTGPPLGSNKPNLIVAFLTALFRGLPEDELQSVIFFVALLLKSIFIVVYSYLFMSLFAKQADAWDNLSEFCKVRMNTKNEHDKDNDNDHKYGEKFEKLGKFIIKSTTTKAFKWVFLVQKSYGTASEALKENLIKGLSYIGTTFILPAFFVFMGNQFGVSKETINDVLEQLKNETASK